MYVMYGCVNVMYAYTVRTYVRMYVCKCVHALGLNMFDTVCTDSF